MGTKPTPGEDLDLPDHTACGELVAAVDNSSSKNTPVVAGGVVTNWQLSWDTHGSFDSGHERPEFFFDSASVPARPLRIHLEEDHVDQEKETDDFHDSDAEDVYDLYLAVNGSLDGDLLDLRKLDELTFEEAAILNVPRLKEIWAHTATGCQECKDIIGTLRFVRNVLREDDSDLTAAQPVELDQVDSKLH
jgi:hypothetical protein